MKGDHLMTKKGMIIQPLQTKNNIILTINVILSSFICLELVINANNLSITKKQNRDAET